MYGVAGDNATDLDQIGRFLFNFGNPTIYYGIQKNINTNSFYGLVPRRYYRIQKTINTNSFHGRVQGACAQAQILFYLIQKLINTNSFHGHVQGACARASADIISYRKV